MTEDVVAIQQLLHRYCIVVDSGTPDEVANLFHETPHWFPSIPWSNRAKAVRRSANGSRRSTGTSARGSITSATASTSHRRPRPIRSPSVPKAHVLG